MMADGEQIHSAMYPGSIFGDPVRTTDGDQYPAACTGVCVLRGLCYRLVESPSSRRRSPGILAAASLRISGGCFTAIAAPDGSLLREPLRSGEGVVIADLDFALIDRRKQPTGFRAATTAGPNHLSLLIDRTPAAHVRERVDHSQSGAEERSEDRLIWLHAARVTAYWPGNSTPERHSGFKSA